MKERLAGFIGRHGETGLNAQNCFRSWLDIPLNAQGVRQAKAMAGFLKSQPIQHIICSPLLRAFVTADIVAQPHNVFVAQHRGLFPWRLGIFSGLPRDENQDALRLFVKNPRVTVPGGESLEAFEARQWAFWEAALGMAEQQGLTLFLAHTSNCVALANFTEGKATGEPEFQDSVKPGGVAAIYWDGKHHRLEPVFGHEEPAKFGGS